MAGFKKRYYKKKAPAKKRAARGGRKSSAVSSAVKGYVKRALHVAAENKIVEYQTGFDVGSILDSSTLQCRPLTPYPGYMLLQQGVTQGGRVGNTVRPVKVMFNYIARPNAYNAAYNPTPTPTILQMILGWTKDQPGTLPIASYINTLFQFGSISTAPTGTQFDLLNPINTDIWHIAKKWEHKIGYAYSAGTGAVPAVQNYANNDYKLNVLRKMNITKYISSSFKFNDNGTLPYNKGLFLMAQAINPTTGVAFPNTITPIHLDYFVTFEYEDQ